MEIELSDKAIEDYLVNNCSKNYLTPKVIVGFAKNEAFLQETPNEGWSNYLRKRDEILSDLNQEFNLKRVNTILETLVKENILKKGTSKVCKGKKVTSQISYRLPVDKKGK